MSIKGRDLCAKLVQDQQVNMMINNISTCSSYQILGVFMEIKFSESTNTITLRVSVLLSNGELLLTLQ